MSPLRRPLLAAFTIVLSGLLSACGGSHRRFTVRPTPLVSIFEAPVQLASDPGPTLDGLKRLGVDDVRVLLRWSTVAPAPAARAEPRHFSAGTPGAYPPGGWAPYDAIVREASARHMGVLLNVSGTAPVWASGRGAPRGAVPGVWKPSAAKFALFVRAVGTRYSGHYTPPGAGSPLPRVSFWSIWNEPNLGEANLAPQTVPKSTVESSPRMYRALLDGAWAALKATGHGRDTILIGELAPYGQTLGKYAPGDFGEMVPMRFLRALYCVDGSLHALQGHAAELRGCPTTAAASKKFAHDHPALFAASGFAIHPYASGERAPPNVVLPGEPDFVYLATVPRLERFLDTVSALYGHESRFPLYSTEYGYITNPPFAGGLPPGVAAAYLNWAEYLTWRMPRLRSWDQYLLVDPPPQGAGNFDTGLEYFNGGPKPLFAAYRLPIFLPVTRQRTGHGLEVWGCLRPAHYLHRPQTVRIELQTGGHGTFKPVAEFPVSDPNGYFDTTVKFPGAGRVRLAWSYPHGMTIHSRLVTITSGG